MIAQADARHIPLPDACVQTVCTSVPYWGLRAYKSDHSALIGLEATLAEWLANLVEVFREVRRVLRPDGVCWLNCGDARANDTKWGGQSGHKNDGSAAGGYGGQRDRRTTGLKPKDLIGLAWRLAFALQADGWYLRDSIIWAKGISFDPAYSGSAMPESVRDRTTKGHEYVFLLTKSARYYYDQEAEREDSINDESLNGRRARVSHSAQNQYRQGDEHFRTRLGLDGNTAEGKVYATRNLRSVWAINPEPFSGAICQDCWRYWPEGYHRQDGRIPHGTGCLPSAGGHDHNEAGAVPARQRYCSCGSTRLLSHYATFPTRLVEVCLRLGTSERGCCPQCGAPWRRVVDSRQVRRRDNGPKQATDEFGCMRLPERTQRECQTLGWQPSCACIAAYAERAGICTQRLSGEQWLALAEAVAPDFAPVPCLVFDPFAGACSTWVTALRLGRRFVGLDLSYPYCRLGLERVRFEQPLFGDPQTHGGALSDARLASSLGGSLENRSGSRDHDDGQAFLWAEDHA